MGRIKDFFFGEETQLTYEEKERIRNAEKEAYIDERIRLAKMNARRKANEDVSG